MPTPRAEWSSASVELSDLLARTGLGDRAAFAALYQRSSAHLFAVVLRINRDRAQAEDILQEVYLAVWRAASGFDAARSQPLTWLTSIARNRAIDSLRRAQTQPRLHGRRRDDDEDDDVYEETADDAPGPLELLSRAVEARQTARVPAAALGSAAPQPRAGLFRRPDARRDRRPHAAAARQRQELGAARTADPEAMPRTGTHPHRRLNAVDYSRPELADRLAADYVAGTLRGGARRRLEALLPAHPVLRDAVHDWQDRLAPLSATIEPQAPPAEVWQRIEARHRQTRAGRRQPPAALVAAARRSGRVSPPFASVAALASTLLLASSRPGPGAGHRGARPDRRRRRATMRRRRPGIVASISGDGRAIVTRPLAGWRMAPTVRSNCGRFRPTGAPRSLGVISADAATVVRRDRLLGGATSALAVSLEPPGGSPTGAPTGPVLYSGKLGT